jgi:hypothetical protein
MAAAPGYGESTVTEFIYFVGDPTGFRTIGTVPIVRTTARYNLNGQRVDSTYKGIVVTNGRKIFNQ